MASRLSALKAWAKALKRDVVALWLAARDPRVPWYAKALAGLVAAYALSPIDLIPDFIPVLGYLDDLLLVPLGILLVVRVTPRVVMERARAKAEASPAFGKNVVGLALVLAAWCLVGVMAWRWWV